MNGSWKDKELTWKLINTITEDLMIKQGLFLSPGANVWTAKGDGLSKTQHHKELAARVFSDHIMYVPAFELAPSGKRQDPFCKDV